MKHESCQTYSLRKYSIIFLFIFLLIGLKGGAQNNESFDISINQIEYIDAETEQLTYLDSQSLVKELRLSRSYNHVYVELENSSDIKYSYKVTGEAGFGDWKKSTNEIHLVGLSRGKHQLCIRGKRNGLTSNLQQFNIYILSILFKVVVSIPNYNYYRICFLYVSGIGGQAIKGA